MTLGKYKFLRREIATGRPLTSSSELPVILSSKEAYLLSQHVEELQKQILDLKAKSTQLASELQKRDLDVQQNCAKTAQLEETNKDLWAKIRLRFLLDQVGPEAQDKLLKSPEFAAQLNPGKTCTAFVMAIDIRRSTELMLKARSPELFAQFLTVLCSDLRDIVFENNGIFDKFTGDGILAFFPEFFTGNNAGNAALLAAEQSHEAFEKHYDTSRHCFNAVLKDVGLGIGIDCGTTHLVDIGGRLSVVGTPVVYATRLSGGDAGVTLLNQPAYEQVFEKLATQASFTETQVDVKHEGALWAYAVKFNRGGGTPSATIEPKTP